MRPFQLVCALALALAAGSAHAQSFIPGNQVDDFGPSTYKSPPSQPKEPVVAWHASPIPGNQIDDFGPIHYSERAATEDQLGAAGGEPGMDAKAAERAQERAAVEEYNRARFLHDTWAPTP